MRALIIFFLVFTLAACGDKTTEAETQDTVTETVPTETPEATQVAEKPNITYTYPDVEGKEWAVNSFEYAGTVYNKFGGESPKMTLTGDKVSGFSGCNQYNGTVSLQSDGAISITDVSSTKKLCRDKMTREQQFLELLSTATSYRVNSIFLEMDCEKGKISFRTALDIE